MEGAVVKATAPSDCRKIRQSLYYVCIIFRIYLLPLLTFRGLAGYKGI